MPKINFLRQKLWPVERTQTDRQTDTHTQSDRDSKNRRTYRFFLVFFFLIFFIDERSNYLSIGSKKWLFCFLPDLGWEIKLVHPFYSFHWLQGHKKYIFSILNHASTQNSWHAIEFLSILRHFWPKNCCHLKFWKIFQNVC